MRFGCSICKGVYDIAEQWTICPHNRLDEPIGVKTMPDHGETPKPLKFGTYTESPAQRAQREKAFIYHPPKDGQPARYVKIRDTGNDFAELLALECPPSRELSLAMTKLEEAIFWANAAIARNE